MREISPFAMRAVKRGLAAGVAALALLGMPSAEARVYWLLGRADSHGAADAGQPGWKAIRETRLQLNGGSARLEVVGCDMSVDVALRQLDQTYRGMGARVYLFHGDRISWGIAVWGDRIVRMLVLGLESPRESLLIRLDQSRDEFARSLKVPQDPPWGDLPAVPEGRTLFFAADEQAGTGLLVSRSPALTAAEAQGQMDALMLGRGWKPAGPGSESLAIYVRGQDLCMVQSSALRQENGALVSMIVKRRAEALRK